MSETRRFMRKIASSAQPFYKIETSNKNESQLQIKVNESIDREDYQEALNLLNFGTTESHWIVCTRARVFFYLRKTRRALAAVRDSLYTKCNDCQSCFELLLKIIQKENQQIHTFKEDIDNCLSKQSLSLELRKKFEKLKREEFYFDETSEATGGEFNELTSYYVDKGMILKKVEIVEISSEYRVARAKSTIKAHEVIIFVPESELITLDLARALPEIDKLVNEESKLQSPKHTILSVFLLLHIAKGLNSPFYNYLQSLPRKLESFPIYYDNELLDELEGTYFLNILQRKRVEIEEDLQEVLAHVPEFADLITYDKFIWARMIVSSRIFGIFIEGNKTDALVPIADMLNHRTPKSTTWFFSDEKKGFIVQNNRHEIPKGQEIFDSYGSKCNSRFLLNYGFTIPENPSNEVVNL